MDKNSLKLPDWEKYYINQIDFLSNTERHELICRYKLMQIYQNFYIARLQLIFSNEKICYNNLIENVEDEECIRKMFVQNALLYYNFCVDLSWIMVYLYCLPKDENNFNISEDSIRKAEKEVCYEFITQTLELYISTSNGNLKNKLKLLLNHIKQFWNDICNNSGFRNIYNYTKHQGVYDIIGINPKKFFNLEKIGTNIDIIESRKFDIKKMTEMCVKFNNDFIEYMDKIIDIVISSSNTKNSYSIKEISNNVIKNTPKYNRK